MKGKNYRFLKVMETIFKEFERVSHVDLRIFFSLVFSVANLALD